MFIRCTAVLLAITYPWSCGTPDVAVEFYTAGGYRFSQSERDAIQAIADTTATEVRRLLPTLPRDLVLRVEPGTNVIPETGETGSAFVPNVVRWWVDPGHAGGVIGTVRRELRATLFHEWHHLVRYSTVGYSRSLMDDVISEGLATVFERDAAGASPPWGLYPPDVMNWVTELRALPPDADRRYWLTPVHVDGRRWIGMRAGTYLVDQAMRSSSKSSAELVSTPPDALIRMALGVTP